MKDIIVILLDNQFVENSYLAPNDHDGLKTWKEKAKAYSDNGHNTRLCRVSEDDLDTLQKHPLWIDQFGGYTPTKTSRYRMNQYKLDK